MTIDGTTNTFQAAPAYRTKARLLDGRLHGTCHPSGTGQRLQVIWLQYFFSKDFFPTVKIPTSVTGQG